MILLMTGIGTLRFLLALAVLLLHSDFVEFEAAQIAVLTFFYLSGFLMQRAITRYLNWQRFLLNRFLRLTPTLLVISLLTWTIIARASDEFLRGFGFIYLRDATSYGAAALPPLSSLITIDANPTIPYLGFESELVPQAWSIGNEMLFYLSVPFLATLGLGSLAAVLLMGISLSTFLILTQLEEFDYLIYTNVFATYSVFLLGFFFAKYFRTGVSISPRISRIARYLCYLLIVFSLRVDFPDWIAPLGVISYSFVLGGVLTLGFLLEMKDDGFISRTLGKISFPLYISHMIVIGILNQLALLNGPLVVAIATLFALLLYLTLDFPLERFRRRLRAASEGVT